jgi:peptidylprolyl isomerase
VIRRRTLLASALSTSAVLALAACSDDGSGSGTSPASGSDGGGASDGGASDGGGDSGPTLDQVKVSKNLDKEPKVEFDTPLEISQPSARAVVKGKGDRISEGDTIVMRSMFVDATKGKVVQSWWEGAAGSQLTITADSVGKEAFEFFTSATVGSRIAMAGWQQNSSTGQMQSLVQVADIDGIALPRAKGKKAKPSGDWPTVKLGKNGAPSLSGKAKADAPDKTVVEPLITGEGKKTHKGDWLVMHYTGWTLEDGKKFDSSWDRGEPFAFKLGSQQVIQGWDEGLVGTTVGSQVMLVVPDKEAYGGTGSELDGKDLVFVADVLGSVPLATS